VPALDLLGSLIGAWFTWNVYRPMAGGNRRGLSPHDPALQPGFERADTTLPGCVSFYGVYDFTNRHAAYRHDGLRRLLERWVIKARFEEARALFQASSPLSRVSPAAPPFFVIHGDRDTLVPVAEARHFVAALRAASRQPVAYAEIPAAQHAFEIFPSRRCVLAIDGVERFRFWLRGRHLARTRGRVVSSPAFVSEEVSSRSTRRVACPTST
jgi:acetyl esterase/lipase